MADNWWESDETVPSPATSRRERVQARKRERFWVKDETVGRPTGEAHDGDTFKLSNGQRARLSGYDAFELQQQAQTPLGQLIGIGQQSRDALIPQLTPATRVAVRGAPSYGRPVVGIENDGTDPVVGLLREGNGLAAPEYLSGDPERLGSYMEAERFARQNRAGAFGNTFATPKAARSGKGEPWSTPDARAGGEAVFFDDPTPLQGLRPDIERGYLALTNDRNSTPDQILAYAKANGFSVDPDTVRKFVRDRNKGVPVADGVTYEKPPRVLTDLDDGRTGATLRGFADPINMLDEMGAVVDSLGGTPGRESLLNSDRRFGDILANNLDQNRSILANDEASYPWYRFGGQMASGLIAPGASLEGVGLAAARNALRSGGTRFAAKAAAGRAVTTRLGTVGAVEGSLAGAGQGETWTERGTGALMGGTVGGMLGVGLGTGAPALGRFVGSKLRRTAGEIEADPAAHQFINGASDTLKADVENAAVDPRAADLSAFDASRDELLGIASRSAEAEADVKATLNAVGPDYPFANALDDIRAKHGPDDGAWHAGDEIIAPPSALETAAEQPSLIGPRVPDRIDVQQPRPLADGPTDWQRFAAAESLSPRDVLPVPANTVDGLDEAARIEAGRVVPVKAPDEMKALASRTITSPIDGLKTMQKRGPLDLVTWLRTKGGIKAQGGELEHAGIDNTPRKLDFAGGEGRFGKLVNNEGMTYDEAGEAAWEAGFFTERPTPAEFLDALTQTHNGNERRFLPEDSAEIDDFLRAREERYAVEAANFDGAPLSVDRGQPVDMADLDANAAPVVAYEEWGENAPDFAGNINLTKLNSPQEIRRALTHIDRANGGFDAATRGRITHAETEALAADMGMTPRDLLRRRKGEAFNAEQALAARQILAKAGNEVVNLAKKVSNGNATEREMLAFRHALVQTAAIQEQVAGVAAEAGRALSSMRAIADANAVRGYVLRDAMEALGGPDGARVAADAILEAKTPAQRAKTIRAMAKPGFFDKVIEVYYNNLLSGPQTHAVNILSNTLTMIGQLPETAVSAGVGAVRTAFSKDRTDRVLFSEVGARAIGMMAGGLEGLKNGAKTFVTGELSDQTMKVESARQRAIAGLKGSIIRTPTRALAAEDEFFKAVSRRSELWALAVRQAAKEGNRNPDKWARVSELVTNPTEEMEAGAHDFAKYMTFQRSLSSGHGLSQQLQIATTKVPILKFALPFVRTPANLMKFAAERSLAAPLVKEWRRDFAAGGAQRDAAIGRFITGNVAMGTVWSLADSGMLTGAGPADPKALELLKADGWQAYSLKVGDTYYSYQRLDPFAALFGTVANFRDLQEHMTDKQREKVAMTLVSATIHNLGDKVWLSGLSNLIKAADDPDRYWEAYAKRQVGSLVPAGVAQVARTIDPVLRDTDGYLDAIKARVPGLSKSLAPRRDVLGREMRSEGGVGPDIVSPLWTTTRRNEALPNALLKAGVSITRTSTDITIPDDLRGLDGKKDLRLNKRQMSDLQGMVGDIARPQLDGLIASIDWSRMDQLQRQKAVNRVMKDARDEARSVLLPAFLGRGRAQAAPVSPGLAGNPDAWWMQDETVR